jgi:hypothetical protein
MPFCLVAGRGTLGEAMGVADLIRDIYVRLLAGYPTDAVIRASVLAEALLKHVLGKAADAKGMLGELIGEASREKRDVLGAELLGELNRLNKLRIEAAHFTGREQSVDDVHHLVEAMVAAAIQYDLISASAASDARRQADWNASEPASTALLRLDRAEQRRSLDDLLALSRRVIVLLLHGEVGQGHDHFGEVVTWRTRAVPKGVWRQVHVEWPTPSPSVGTRLAALLENFAAAVNLPFSPPAADPATDAGEAALRPTLEAMFAALDRSRERIYVRHMIGWLEQTDVEVVRRYLKLIWVPLAQRAGERLVCCLELRRAELGGLPLTKAWRISHNERRIAKLIADELEESPMPQGGHFAAIPELTSVSANDLADWLRTERQLARSAAVVEANQLVSVTRGGRFDSIVQRLSSFNSVSRKPK